MKSLFEIPSAPLVPVKNEIAGFPVHRVFCVGRNYAAHAAEMGAEVDREQPFYFMKPATSVTLSGAVAPYPPGTNDLHHEMELVIAIGAPTFRIGVQEANKSIFGFAAGLDMTRRDLQSAAKQKQRPWDLGKSFEHCAVISEITRAEDFGEIGERRIWLKVGEDIRQDALLSDMVWSVPEIVSHLSGYYQLGAGDLIYTGTPAGVGQVVPGDQIHGEIEGLSPVKLAIGPVL